MPVVVDQRGRILDAALRLMADQGAVGASMRQLAAACDLNVATLYHYFPSKADLLESVVRERRCGEHLDREGPPVDVGTPPRERLVALLDWLWTGALEEQAVWRLTVGEAIRGEPAAARAAAQVLEQLDATLERSLRSGLLVSDGDPAALARVIRGHVVALVVEHLALGEVTPATAHARAEELAAALVPSG